MALSNVTNRSAFARPFRPDWEEIEYSSCPVTKLPDCSRYGECPPPPMPYYNADPGSSTDGNSQSSL